MLYQWFRMRTKCVCYILSILPTALFSRANIISWCQASFSGCPRRNHQSDAGICAGGYLISVATHRGGLIQLSWFATSIKVAVFILSASLCLPFVEREAPDGGTHRRIVTLILKSKTDRALPDERDLEGWDWQISAGEHISIHVSNPFQRSVSISTWSSLIYTQGSWECYSEHRNYNGRFETFV